MKHHLPPLDTLKAFESAARHLSFTLAAEELCISKGAVSYQIRRLEEVLQCSLFKRSVRQVYLTEAGQALLHTTAKLFDELGETLERLADKGARGGVSVAATTYVAARWLSSHISRFNEQHGEVAVLLQHSVNSADFKLADVDLAIRWGQCRQRTDPNCFAELPMALFPAISPKLLQRLGTDTSLPLSAKQLQQAPFNRVPLLCEDRQQDMWQEWLQAAGVRRLTLQNPRRIISDANVRVQAAVDGQGLVLADHLMLNELDNGLLTAPFKEQLNGYGYVFMSAGSRLLNDDAQTLKAWLKSTIITSE
jgi:LysR family glycine cleavage system transcriptional activator